MTGKRKFLKILLSLLLSAVILVLLVVVAPMLPTTIDHSFSISSHTDKSPLLVAHRGLSSVAPQNSIPAFEAAAEYGFDGYEFDIHTTKDGHWVVIHDETVDAMTDGTGNVADFTLEEIRQLKLDAGNGIENYTDLKVPTLEEALDICLTSGIFPVIEIKNCDVQYLPLLKETLDSYNLSERAVIISFTEEYLDIYRQLDKDIEILLLASSPTKEVIDRCIEKDFGINFCYILLYQCADAIGYAREKGVKIGAWTVDNTVYEDVMVLFGAEIITTNKIVP